MGTVGQPDMRDGLAPGEFEKSETNVNPPIDIAALADNLVCGPDGIWFARARSQISYPEEGNQNCLALEADSFWFRHRNRCIETVMRRFSPAGTVFDIGGGNGYVAVGLEQAGFPVALVEPGLQGAQNARRRGLPTVICSTLEDASFHKGALPAASLFDVLEHIQEELAFLQRIHSLLIPGGRLYLTVPAFPALWSADDDYAGHFRRYTRASLSHVLSAAGFRVIFSSYIFWMLPLPIFLVRSVPTRLGWRKQEAWSSYQQEHRSQPGLTGKLLDSLLRWELHNLQKGRPMWLGGSCLVVAEK